MPLSAKGFRVQVVVKDAASDFVVGEKAKRFEQGTYLTRPKGALLDVFKVKLQGKRKREEVYFMIMCYVFMTATRGPGRPLFKSHSTHEAWSLTLVQSLFLSLIEL